MTALIVVVCILLVFFLIGQIRVGAAVAYSEQGLFVKVKIGPVTIQILPPTGMKSKKEKKQKTPSKVSADSEAKPVQKKNVKDTLSLVLRFLPLVGEAAGRFKRKIRIDRLRLYVIWGASDPASAAKGYGAGNAALGIIWPVLDYNFNVKEHDLRVDVDFEREAPEIVADAQATLTIGQSLVLALRVGLKALKIYLGYRREQNEQKAVQV